jgi:hypothetical protein
MLLNAELHNNGVCQGCEGLSAESVKIALVRCSRPTVHGLLSYYSVLHCRTQSFLVDHHRYCSVETQWILRLLAQQSTYIACGCVSTVYFGWWLRNYTWPCYWLPFSSKVLDYKNCCHFLRLWIFNTFSAEEKRLLMRWAESSDALSTTQVMYGVWGMIHIGDDTEGGGRGQFRNTISVLSLVDSWVI